MNLTSTLKIYQVGVSFTNVKVDWLRFNLKIYLVKDLQGL